MRSHQRQRHCYLWWWVASVARLRSEREGTRRAECGVVPCCGRLRGVGRDSVQRKVMLHGTVDRVWQAALCVALGELGAVCGTVCGTGRARHCVWHWESC